MGSGDIIAGSNPPTRRPKKPTTVIVRNPARGAGASSRRSEITSTNAADGHCGAMSQQRADSGTTMAPQKFLHLVGCREPNARGPGGR